MANSNGGPEAGLTWKERLQLAVNGPDVHELLRVAAPQSIDVRRPLTQGTPVEVRNDSVRMAVGLLVIFLVPLLLVGGEMLFMAGPSHRDMMMQRAILPTARIVAPALLAIALAALVEGWYFRARRTAVARRFGLEFVACPSREFGYDIVVRSILASGGNRLQVYGGLLRGMRNGVYFQAIDFARSVGKGSETQTVVCVRLPRATARPFAIIDRALLPNCDAVGKEPLWHQPAELGRNEVAVADHLRTQMNIPPEFLALLHTKQNFNVEVRPDRLLLYRLRERLSSDTYMEWVDFAIALSQLAQQA